MKVAPVIMLALLVCSPFLVVAPLIQEASGLTPANISQTDCTANANKCTTTAFSVGIGNLIAVGVMTVEGTSTVCPTSITVNDSLSSVFSATIPPSATTCKHSAFQGHATGAYLYAASSAGGSASDKVTVTLNGVTGGHLVMKAELMVYNGTFSSTAISTQTVFSNNTKPVTLAPSIALPSPGVVIGVIFPFDTLTGPGVPTSITECRDVDYVTDASGQALCGTATDASVAFAYSQTHAYGGFISAASFKASPILPATFTAQIMNLDCGNCVVAGNGKFYDFQANMTSNAVALTDYNSSFWYARMYFNDSVHSAEMEYDFSNTTTQLVRGGGIVSLAATTSSITYNATLGIYTAIVDFHVTFNSVAVQTENRGIQLVACLLNGDCYGSGYTYAGEQYFNILNEGGATGVLSTGLCSHTSGSDSFATQCIYDPSPTSLIQTNSTWTYLQSYATQFSIVLGDNGTGDTRYWHSDANGSFLATGWHVDIGFYFWDGTQWVWGPNVYISALDASPHIGSNQWIELQTSYFFGSTLISNQSMNSWVQPYPLSAVPIYVDLWYSTINASTTWGGRVSAYYEGMSESCFLTCLWGGTWSPVQNNQSTSQSFGTLYDHTGSLISSTQINCTIVSWTMARTSERGVVNNYQISSQSFEISQFNTAGTPSQMGGVLTPIYNQPLIPTITGGFNLLAPLYSALASIGGFFTKALVALGNVIWSQLGARFPWFTAALSNFASLMVQFGTVLTVLGIYIVDGLNFFISVLKFLVLPIQVVIDAYNFLIHTFAWLFGGIDITKVLEAVVLFGFAVFVIGAAESKDPTHEFISFGRAVWHIADTILFWTWSLAKILIDTIEGLIP